METPTQKTVFSGIQPSGTIHIGNYLGALRQWVDLQTDNTAYFCIVDEHAITVPYDRDQLSERVMTVAALYLALGIDPNKSVIFIQSHVSAHAELAWLLGTTTPYGELTRMTQFKDKSKKQQSGTTVGLFTYPVLMAADILLYNTDVVPVGEDQTQHLELTRDIAKRFNNQFGDIFHIPEAFMNKSTARIMSLTDPSMKMSKSDPEKTYVSLLDDPDTISQKIRSAVTETEPVFSFTDSGPAVKNLLNMYQAVSGKDSAAIEQEFQGKGYKEFKETLAEAIVEHLRPIQERYLELRQDDSELRITLGRGAHQAQTVANQTLHQVKEAMGLL